MTVDIFAPCRNRASYSLLIVRCPAHCEPSRRFFGTGFKHRRYCRARCRIGRKTMRALSRPPASRDSNGLPSLCERPCRGKPPPRRQARSSYRNRIHMSYGPLFPDRPPYLSSASPHRAPRTEKDILEKRPAVDHLAIGLSFRHRPRPLRNPARSVYLGLIGIFSSKYQVRGLIFLPESSPAPCIRRYSHAPDTPVPRSPSQAPVPLNLSGTIASG